MSAAEPLPYTLDFPENIVAELKEVMTSIEEVDHVLGRPLRPTDPNGSVGVYAMDWRPQDFQIGQHDPATSRYMVIIQTFVKHGDDEEGVILHARLAKKVRVMLYRNDDLRVRLGSLSTQEDGVIERLQRWGVQTQRYLSNELEGNFLHLAITELWIETEMV